MPTMVILTYSYHNIAVKSEKHLRDITAFESYYPLLDTSAKKVLESSGISYNLASLKYDYGIPVNIYKNIFGIKKLSGMKMLTTDYGFYGGPVSNFGSFLDHANIARTIRRHFYNDTGQYAGMSEINLKYLDRIICLCRVKGITVYLYAAPLHKKYLAQVPPQAIHDYNITTKQLMYKYSNVKLINMLNFDMASDCFYDGYHINESAKKTVTTELMTRL